MLAALLADLEQRLLAHAHAEEGPAAGDVLADGLHQGVPPQVGHRVGGGAHARHDEGVGTLHVAAAGGDQGLAAGVGDGAGHAAQVAGLIIDDDELHGRIVARGRGRARLFNRTLP